MCDYISEKSKKANQFKLTLLESVTPLTKTYTATNKKPKAAGIYKGTAKLLTLNLIDLVDLHYKLTPNQALLYGVTKNKNKFNKITVLKNKKELKLGAIARSKDYFEWTDGRGIWYIDIDGSYDENKINSLLGKIYRCMPEINEAPHFVTRSSSHGITIDGVRKNGGAHIYVLVDNAGAIPELTKTLYIRLFDEFGHYIISKDNKALERSLIDKSVSQPERIDYAAAPVIKTDKVTRINTRPMVFNVESEPLRTSEVKKLSDLELKNQLEKSIKLKAEIVKNLPTSKKMRHRNGKVGKYSLPEIDLDILSVFKKHLPKWPFSTDNYNHGLRKTPMEVGIKRKHIQPNGPTHMRWIVLDVDRLDAVTAWRICGCPEPNIIVENPLNGHAHYFYLLKTPVRTTSEPVALATINYAKAIITALQEKVGADANYHGSTAKNPLNPSWNVNIIKKTAYTLAELSSNLELKNKNIDKKRKKVCTGRNQSLFEDLSKWAYSNIRKEWPELLIFEVKCFEKAKELNVFVVPLDDSEVKSISKSVARFVHKNFTEKKFKEIQSKRGRRGGETKGINNLPKRIEALELLSKGYNIKEASEFLGVHRNTIGKWVKGQAKNDQLIKLAV